MDNKVWLLILTLTISLLVRHTSSASSLFDSHLQYDYYGNTCPEVEDIILTKMKKFYKQRPDVAPALLRMIFHDCFIQGCDASVLLDRANGFEVEKDIVPNLTLKGFDIIEDIKSEVERVCPATVSCSDILALAARDGVALVGGPFYPLYTGRRDSQHSFPDIATAELPNPQANISTIQALFNSRGFTDREITALLGSHSIGTFHCEFFRNRLYNFNGTGQPDPSLDTGFLNRMRGKCPATKSKNPAEEMEIYDGMADGSAFGNRYYTGLMKGKSILRADEQLMANNGTATVVRAYSSDASAFRRDFARAMIKLSHYQVLTFPRGQIRQKCSMVL